MAKFSVVIPLYNKESKIQRTLESVLNQTFEDFEVIIVNDGSTDKSVEVVSQIKDERIRLINKPNGGVSSARNKGIKESRFEWIAFLDADDLWAKNKLEKVADTIRENPSVSWLISGYKILKSGKTNSQQYYHNGFLDDALDALLNGLTIQTSAVVVKRQCFKEDSKLFFPIGINNSEDREVWYRLIFKFQTPYYIQDILSYYVIDETGNSLNSGTAGNFSYLGLKKRLSDSFEMLPIDRQKKFKIFINRFNKQGSWSIWVKVGWKNEFKESVTKTDEILMKLFSNFPASRRRWVLKLRGRFPF